MTLLGWLAAKLGRVRVPADRPQHRVSALSVGNHDRGIGPGRWVVHDGAVGVVHERRPLVHQDLTRPDGSEDAVQLEEGVVVHFTNEAGETTRETHVPLHHVRIARCAEIPEPRRPAPGMGKAYGYEEP